MQPFGGKLYYRDTLPLALPLALPEPLLVVLRSVCDPVVAEEPRPRAEEESPSTVDCASTGARTSTSLVAQPAEIVARPIRPIAK